MNWNDLKEALEEGDMDAVMCLDIIQGMDGITQPADHHPEGTVLTHMNMVMHWIFSNSDDIFSRFGALVHDFGKTVTPKSEWPKHHNHEKMGVDQIRGFCMDLDIPDQFMRFGALCSEFHTHRHRCQSIKTGKLARFLIDTLLVRDPNDLTFQRFMEVCDADARGRGGDYPVRPMPEKDFLLHAADAVRGVVDRDSSNPQVLIGDCAQAISALKGSR
jgi:tRNA nucleotidyltransferase (CCA-adding enzyme)